uniref:Diguanylate cyclase/phosphodiesterase with PAS/PAC sensor(S) n=1 Tax=uncultured bacterium Contigcl_23 TaxID=1393667 RepID=W0FRD9_9BACT|nr:diguanylate cyclase/phosphodiesterase with PAS/PAC sensor(s) [uncultured bacterium Contigcl_23]
MSDQIRIRDILRQIGARSIAVAIIVILIINTAAAFIGNRFYATKKEVLNQRGELNAKESAREYDRCLLTRVNIVTMVGRIVENMLASGTSTDKIEKYLIEQTNNIVATLDPTTTGLYGWIGGEYLDGAGWVPDDDFVPTERPWYIQTMESDQEITFVEPYLDMQTNTVMMTVSDLMSDGQSVLAMDVSLDPLQEIVKRVVAGTEGSQALVLDHSGIVVAHSDETQLGRNYLAESGSLGSAVANRILDDGEKQFELRTAEGDYSVYVDQLEGGWYSVSLINANTWYLPLRSTIIIFSVIVTLVVASMGLIFLRISAKNLALRTLHTKIDREEKRSEALQALSETDRMTGLYDRVNGQRKVEELLASGSSGVFMELDIDHFKAINDTCGHQAGDSAIRAVAESMRNTFRSNDICMRLGGDEFGVFAVGIIREEMAAAIVYRLFEWLDKAEIPELQGEKFSVSVGAALHAGDQASCFDELYAQADSAMYISKKAAGNMLTLAGSRDLKEL